MNKCLQCKKEYEAARPTSKFCSDNCRVKYHRANKGKQSSTKGQIGKIELEVLYNKILNLVGNLDNIESTKGNKVSEKANHFQEEPLDLSSPSVTKSDLFISEIKACRDKNCINKIMAQVKKSDLGWRSKFEIEAIAVELSDNYFDD